MSDLYDLEKVLNDCGKNPLVMNDSILILPFGGRVLGLFPDKETNVFWVNEALQNTSTALNYFNEPGWLNTGGDRTWISPEGETHVPDLSRYPASIEVPGSVDPASYEVLSQDSQAVTIGVDMKVRFHQSRTDVPLRVEKKVQALVIPPVDLPGNVRFAGYRANTSLRVTGAVQTSARPGIWSLLQVPGGGDILCPVHKSAHPTAFFNPSAYEQKRNLITVRVKTDTSYKFALKASDSTGRILYRKLDSDRSILIVRNFTVVEQSRYADYPCANPADEGYLTEIYIDDGQLGGFGEMEYHSPAIEMKKGEQFIEDSSVTWGYTGPEQLITELVEKFIKGSG